MMKFSADTIKNINIISDLTTASLKARFRNTWGGVIWVILNPIITYTVHCFILAKVLNLNIPNLPIFILGGVLPWTFFSLSLDMGPSAVLGSKDLVKSFSISPLLIIFVVVIENFVTFLMSFFLVTLSLSVFYQFPLMGIAYLPFAFVSLFLFTLFTVIGFSILNIFFRDIKFIISFALNLLFFLTPILYPAERFPQDLNWLITINPLYHIIVPIRSCIYYFYEPVNLANSLRASLSILFAFVFAAVIWKKYRNEIWQKL